MARLMVVDDDPDICDLVVRRLVREGHEVMSADGGTAALDLSQRHGMPDAAILDIAMPGMSGFVLLDRLRALQPDLPALFLTVLWPDDVHTRAQGVGYVPKPFTAAQLVAGVRQLLAPACDGDAAHRSNP